MLINILHILSILLLGSLFSICSAQTSLVQQVIDMAGGTSSNSTCVLNTAAGQSHPVGYSHTSAYLLNSGFIQSSTNESGIGVDSDGDGVADWTEQAGNQFIPNTPTDSRLADSDGDGASDQAEIAMGTNPMDAESCFKIISIAGSSTNCLVKWLGRQGYQYVLAGATDMPTLSTNATSLTNLTGMVGAGAWLATELQVNMTAPWTNGFYKVQLNQ